jgi:hypothetical protein
MRTLIAMKLSVDGMANWVKAWSDDYGLSPQIDACVVGEAWAWSLERMPLA